MSTLRVARRSRYTSVDRRTINDTALSYRARGVLVWLLDKPDDWRADATSIASGGTEGRDAIRSALRELEAGGYLVRSKRRDEGTGRWVTEHVLYEHPSLAHQGGLPAQADQPRVTSAGDPGAVVNPTDVGTETEPCNDLVLVAAVAPATGPAFDEFWQAYPKRHGKRVGRADTEPLWARLTAADRELAMAAVAHYRAACDSGVTYAMDAHRWLRKRELWAETWQTPAEPSRRGQPGPATSGPRYAPDAAADAERRARPSGRIAL